MSSSIMQRDLKSSPYVTGFCDTGAHEGTKIFSQKGTLLRSCSGVFVILGKQYICRCDCHEAFRQIAELTGMTTSAPAALIMPVDLIGAVYGPSSIPTQPTGTDAPTLRENAPTAATGAQIPAPSPPSDGPPPAPIRIFSPIPVTEQFAPTPTGQRARGQLEAQVGKVIHGLFGNTFAGTPITPSDCAMMVNPAYPPSQGAVYSIFQRWSRQGYCELSAKPFKLTSLTESGKRYLARWGR